MQFHMPYHYYCNVHYEWTLTTLMIKDCNNPRENGEDMKMNARVTVTCK